MWQPRSVCFLMAGWMLAAVPATAQEAVSILVETNLPEASVYADSVYLGTASRGFFVVPAQTRRLRLLPPGGDAWSVAPVSAALEAQPGDTLEVHLPFPYHYKIESVPFGATVIQKNIDGRSALGETPLLYRSDQPLSGLLLLEKPGYLPLEFEPGQAVWNRHVLTLQQVDLQDTPSAELSWKPPKKHRRWIDYSAAALAIGAGALAVHYKFKADRIDDRYRDTGDPLLRDDIRAYDTRAAISLGVMQAGIGILAIRFVLR